MVRTQGGVVVGFAFKWAKIPFGNVRRILPFVWTNRGVELINSIRPLEYTATTRRTMRLGLIEALSCKESVYTNLLLKNTPRRRAHASSRAGVIRTEKRILWSSTDGVQPGLFVRGTRITCTSAGAIRRIYWIELFPPTWNGNKARNNYRLLVSKLTQVTPIAHICHDVERAAAEAQPGGRPTLCAPLPFTLMHNIGEDIAKTIHGAATSNLSSD